MQYIYIVYIDSGKKKIKEKSLVNSNSANYMDILKQVFNMTP